MQPGGWAPVSEAIGGLTKSFTERNSQNPKRDLLCVLEYANKGVLPDSIEPYPRIQVKCVQRGFSPHNPEIPERMTNALGINMEYCISFYESEITCDHTHARLTRNDTERRNAPVPKRVWYTTDPGRQSNSTTQRIARRESYAGNSLRRSEVADTMRRFRHDRIRNSLDQSSDPPHSASHWPSGQRLEKPVSRLLK